MIKMTKKIPISFNNKELENLRELSDIYGIKGTYGEIPQTIRISITLAKKYIEMIAEIIPDFNTKQMPIFLTTIKNIKEIEKLRERELDFNKLMK